MSFTPKAWQNLPSETTPVDAAALIDLETRLSGYTDAETTRAETGEAAAQANAIAASTKIQAVAPVVTTSTTLAINKLTPVNSSAGALTQTLPIGQAAGSLIAVQNVSTTTTLSAALSTGAPITALPVVALPYALVSGVVVTVASGINTQTWTLSAPAAAGATTLAVNSQTPNFAYPIGATVTPPINLVTITGNIRDIASASVTLKLTDETILFVADSSGSWWPEASHKTLSSLDARYTLTNASGPGQLPGSVANATSATLGQQPTATGSSVYTNQSKLVFDARDYGVTANGTTDDRAALAACVLAAETAIQATGYGAVVQLPAGVINLASGVTDTPFSFSTQNGVPILTSLPATLVVRGEGRDGVTTIQLNNTGALNAFWIQYQHQGDTFKNVLFEDFDVNVQGAEGIGHILIGNVMGGKVYQTLSFYNVRVRRIKTYGTPVDNTGLVTNKCLIQMIGQNSASPTTAQTTQQIICEDCDILDAQQGLVVTTFVGNSCNQYYDRIEYRRCYHSQSAQEQVSETSFYICGAGYGDKCVIEDCFSNNIGDDTIEIGAMRDVLIDNTAGIDMNLEGITFRHSYSGFDPTDQHVVVRKLKLKADNTLGTISNAKASGISWIDDVSVGFGSFTLEDVVYTNDSAFQSKQGRADVGLVIPAVTIRELRFIRPIITLSNYTYDVTYNTTMSFFNIGLASGEVLIRDASVYIKNLVTTSSGGIFFEGLLAQQQAGSIVVDGLNFEVNGYQSGGTLQIVNLGRGGSIRRVTLRRIRPKITSGSGITGVAISGVVIAESNSYGAGLIEDCDFGSWGADITRTAGGTNALRTIERDNIYATLKPAFTITPGTSPYTYQNSTGVRQAITIANGTISTIAVQGQSGSSYTTGLTSGTLIVDNGQSVIVTYSSAPTMTALPLI